MLLLGIDIGTSSIKVSVVDGASQQTLASASYPETETAIKSPQPGWAEQDPDTWWEHTQKAILKLNATGKFDPNAIGAIGIAYQMHGLVLVDRNHRVLRPAIIWCDSRAVPYGKKAFKKIGEKRALEHLLNSPGNFTAAKLAWVKEHQPDIYEQIDKIMLPGDYIAGCLTGIYTSSVSALSEGIFWDFKKKRLSKDVFEYFGFDESLIPEIRPVFSDHGFLSPTIAAALSLRAGIPVAYKSGDQPNNALSLNVLDAGEVAATAGTSGVIYGVSDELTYDPASRVNSFAHVNYDPDDPRIGVLLCINGTGILNSWIKQQMAAGMDYPAMNEAAAKIDVGADGLTILPFGNGAERMLENAMPGASIHGWDFNIHRQAHFFRAAQEGIAAAFRYGLDIMRENGMSASVIRAGRANLFLSPVFTEAFVETTGVPVELYATDGSIGAALGAGIGAGFFNSPKEAFSSRQPLDYIEPKGGKGYEELYERWEKRLKREG